MSFRLPLLLSLPALVLGCARATTPPVDVFAEAGFSSGSLRRLAVIEASPGPAAGIPPGSLGVVTELLVQAAARGTDWEILEPEATRDAFEASDAKASLAERVGAAAAATGADAGLTVLVLRYRERVGSDFGVSEPASVGVRLLLVPAGGSEPVWRADYAHTQLPLSENLWNLWGVLRGGPKWLTAAELARIGIDEAVSRLGADLRR